MLALGVAVVVIGIIAVIVMVVVMNSTSSEQPAANETADQNAQAAPPTPLPGENPEVKTPIQPPAQQAPPPTATPTAAVVPPPILQEDDDCPDSTLAVKGITWTAGRMSTHWE